MLEKLKIRESRRDDWAVIESLYVQAFPDENLLPLVRDLLNDLAVALSFVGTIDGQIGGHVIFTRCGVVGHRVNTALLGPLAVAPSRQRQGIGRAIVRTGLQRLKKADITRVYVLGDPAFYRRLGFVPESLVEPPFSLPAQWEGAWQSQELGETGTPCAGKLSVPPQWLQRNLWTP